MCLWVGTRAWRGGATVIPLFSSVSSTLEVVRLANKTYRDDETTYFVRWLGGFAAASSAIFIALVFLINMLINLYVN
jgi:hypothetical protein